VSLLLLLVKFMDALYDVGRIFEPLTQRACDQWQHWIETTVQQYEAVAA